MWIGMPLAFPTVRDEQRRLSEYAIHAFVQLPLVTLRRVDQLSFQFLYFVVVGLTAGTGVIYLYGFPAPIPLDDKLIAVDDPVCAINSGFSMDGLLQIMPVISLK